MVASPVVLGDEVASRDWKTPPAPVPTVAALVAVAQHRRDSMAVGRYPLRCFARGTDINVCTVWHDPRPLLP